MHSLLPGVLGCLALTAGLCVGGAAACADESGGECPGRDEVVAGLGQVLTARPDAATAKEIVIRDEGASWSIEVRGHRSTFSDPTRDCAERARVAAVFAALALEPVDKDEDPVAPVQAELQPNWSLEIGPELALGTLAQAHNNPLGWGGQARLSRSRRGLGGSLGVELTTFSKLDLGGYGASLTRAVCDLSGRILWAPGSLVLAGELGPTLALLHVRGTGLVQSPGSQRMDMGVRAAVMARLRSRLAPFLALQAELGFRRFDLAVEPSGDIGAAPRLWLGLAAGGAFDF